jgi:hypothetical protein
VVELSGSLRYKIILSANRDSLLLLYLNLFSFSYALARNYTIMLNKVERVDTHVSFPMFSKEEA